MLRMARCFGLRGEMQNPDFDPFQVRLLRMGTPLVNAALAAYEGRPPKIPFRIRVEQFGGIAAEEVYFVKGPTGVCTMSTGRDALNQIIDKEAEILEEHGAAPRKMKLPVLMAYDLAKCRAGRARGTSRQNFLRTVSTFSRKKVFTVCAWRSCGVEKPNFSLNRLGASRLFPFHPHKMSWAPNSWQTKPLAQGVEYPDRALLRQTLGRVGRTAAAGDELGSRGAQVATGRGRSKAGDSCSKAATAANDSTTAGPSRSPAS